MKLQPTINGAAFDVYGARLLSHWKVEGGAPSWTFHQAKQSARFQIYSNSVELRKITLPVTIRATDDQDLGLCRAAFEAAMYAGAVELYLPDGFIYDAMLTGISDKIIMDGYHEITYTFSGSRFGRPETVKGLPGRSFTILGTRRADARINVTAGGAAKAYKIADYTFTDIKAGDRIVVDGIKKIVLLNGAPDILRCNLTDWPKFQPGRHRIQASDPFEITYRPAY